MRKLVSHSSSYNDRLCDLDIVFLELFYKKSSYSMGTRVIDL